MTTLILLAALLAASGPAFGADRAPAAARLSTLCASLPLNVDALLGDAPARAELAGVSGQEGRELFDYAVCRELQGRPGICASLDGLGRNFAGSAANCLSSATGARFIVATLHGGDAAAACRASLALEGKRGAATEKDCAALISMVRDGRLSCTALDAAGLVIPGDSCADIMAFWSGDAGDCARYTDEVVKRECLARAALVAGLRAPQRCASSPACQALVAKAPSACDGARARVSSAVCSWAARAVAAERKAQEQLPELRRVAELKAKEETAKNATAKAAAAAAAVRAAAAASDAKGKADLEAERRKVARQAAEQAVKQAAAEAAVKAKAEAEAKKAAAAKAAIERQVKPQFSKGEPMQAIPPDAAEIIKAIEEGRPRPPARKPRPPKAPAADE